MKYENYFLCGIILQNLLENWVSKQSFFVLIFRETLQNFNSIRQPIKKHENNNCLNKLNELKFCEVSRILISNWTWKFQLSILKNKKVLFLKKIFFWPYRQDTSKRWRVLSQFSRRFWEKYPILLVTRFLPLKCHFLYSHPKPLLKIGTAKRYLLELSWPI